MPVSVQFPEEGYGDGVDVRLALEHDRHGVDAVDDATVCGVHGVVALGEEVGALARLAVPHVVRSVFGKVPCASYRREMAPGSAMETSSGAIRMTAPCAEWRRRIVRPELPS